jgi:4-carboxymuconolactone decarboxylase
VSAWQRRRSRRSFVRPGRVAVPECAHEGTENGQAIMLSIGDNQEPEKRLLAGRLPCLRSTSGTATRSDEQEPQTLGCCMQDVKGLTDAGDFGSFGRYDEVALAQMTPEMKEAYEHTMKLRGIVPGPHKIWLANAKLSRTIVPIGAYYQKESTLTKAEIEIVTVLTNARWHSAYGTYEHEKIAEKLGHIPAETTERLIAGLPAEFRDARQQVVYELASTLVQPHIVPMGLYKRAKEALGDAGIVDVAVLIGWFTMVSMTLNAYDVPANATGLDQ